MSKHIEHGFSRKKETSGMHVAATKDGIATGCDAFHRGERFMLNRWLVGISSALCASAAFAAPAYVSYDDFHYSGTVTRYSTLADAENKTNALSTTSFETASNGPRDTLKDARDGQVSAASGAASAYGAADLVYFSTSWYFTTFPAKGNGWGNPNNTNTGFAQYYDLSGTPTVSGGWSNSNTRFTLSISGGNGDSYDVARLWAAPSSGGPAGDTYGVFHSFDLHLVADFSAAATLNSSTGWYETDALPTGVTGGASGIFENESTTDTALNGFYAFDFTFAPGSWAKQESATWSASGETYSPAAFFAAPVPEPSSLALVGIALVSLTATRSRRR